MNRVRRRSMLLTAGDEEDRRLLRQVDALLHRHANLIVHNSFLSIGGAFSSIGEDGGMTFDVGVSTRFIPNALFIAFFSYIHLTSLVVHDELARLWHDHKAPSPSSARRRRHVIFIGVDAAWGDVNETGLVCLDRAGRIRHAGWAVGLRQTVEWVARNSGDDTLVFVDAPLVVTNMTGQRLCETHVGQRYWRASVAANSTNTASPRLGGVARLGTLEEEGFRYDDGIDGPPSSGRVVSECYPYTTIVGYEPLGYDVRPLYKRKPKSMRTAEFKAVRAAACDERVALLADADPPLDLGSHPTTRQLLEERSPLDNRAYKRREDLLDAAICAWTASLWHRHGLDGCQVLGAANAVGRPAATIIAPARPHQRVGSASTAPSLAGGSHHETA